MKIIFDKFHFPPSSLISEMCTVVNFQNLKVVQMEVEKY